jgi:hypothetical protein
MLNRTGMQGDAGGSVCRDKGDARRRRRRDEGPQSGSPDLDGTCAPSPLGKFLERSVWHASKGIHTLKYVACMRDLQFVHHFAPARTEPLYSFSHPLNPYP